MTESQLVHPLRARPQRRRPGPWARGRGLLGTSELALLAVVGVVSMSTVPAMAAYGLGAVPFLLVPAALFLAPVALVVAELGSSWHGGVAVWVREGLGPRWGLAAAWLQWVQGVVRIPVLLAFAAACLALAARGPDAAASGPGAAAVILVLFWGSTLLVARGGTLFARVGAWAGALGVLLPAALLVCLGLGWVATGQPSEVSLDATELVPPYSGAASIVLLVSGVLSFTGLEVGAAHGDQARGPARSVPRAMAAAAALVVGVLVLPALAISLAVQREDTGLAAVHHALSRYLGHWGAGWALPVVSVLLAVGAVGSAIAWTAGPSRGLALAGRSGLLPPLLQAEGPGGAPRGVLLAQGVVVTAFAALFALTPDASAVLVILLAMAAALYLVMYMMMFAAAVSLRRVHPSVVRGFRVPALPVVAVIGFLASLAGFLVAFIPPADALVGAESYPWLIAALVAAVGAPPFVLYALRRPGWDRRPTGERATAAHRGLVSPTG
ncbi:amino acid permease [Cellulomonas cellasea]|uniref:amino acid permease n=1 Tax=Cellulomonas cellasea TaxID=43670 RepID=UPI0025A46CD0|nr:amino acid permease [Cellulomonas cellasea]MDM8083997.1 amino acid permease [Cellulomonas cellasea]